MHDTYVRICIQEKNDDSTQHDVIKRQSEQSCQCKNGNPGPIGPPGNKGDTGSPGPRGYTGAQVT